MKSIDRDVVKEWPEERLVVIGAKKTLKEVYEYELVTTVNLKEENWSSRKLVE